MDRDQSGTLTLSLLAGQPAKMHALQRVLEAAASYYLTVTVVPPGGAEAQSKLGYRETGAANPAPPRFVVALQVMEKPPCRNAAA